MKAHSVCASSGGGRAAVQVVAPGGDGVCLGSQVYLSWQGGLGGVFGPLDSTPDSVAQTLQRAPRLLSQFSQPVHRPYCA
jgi:hypothetical protein